MSLYEHPRPFKTTGPKHEEYSVNHLEDVD